MALIKQKINARSFTEDEKILLRFLFPVASKRLLEYVFGLSYYQLKNKARHLGIPRYYKGNAIANLALLLSDTPISMYWIGMLLADGKISNCRIDFGLNEKDKDHVEKFAKFLSIEKIFIVPSKGGKFGGKYYSSSMHCVRMANKYFVPLIMNKFGLVSNKTYFPPTLSLYESMDINLYLSLLIGYIDGDGSIGLDTKIKKYPNIRVGVYSTWLPFLKLIQKRLMEHFKIKVPTPYICKRGFANLVIGKGTLIRELKKFALENNLPLMERKWNKVILEEESVPLE